MNNYTEAHVRYFQRKHGIKPGTPYDPDLHQDVPALAFGLPAPDNSMGGEGQHLRPELDLVQALGAEWDWYE